MFSVVGELGAGKTLTLSFLIYKNWFFRRKQIFSNMPLYKIPHYRITHIDHLDEMSEGDCALDEIWTVADSRMSLKKKNKFVAGICARSRKKHLNIFATAQMVDQVDKRIRKIIDFTAYPVLSSDEMQCRCNIFRTGYPKDGSFLKTFWFKTPIVMQLYDTDYIVNIEEDDDKKDPMQIIWQENKESEPMFFETWQEADKFGEQFWNKHPSWIKQIF